MIVFGFPENPAELISEKVGEVLQELEEKPKFEAVKIEVWTENEKKINNSTHESFTR